MGLFARFVCLQRKDGAHDLARTVRGNTRCRIMPEAAVAALLLSFGPSHAT
jgi:hypothetical protein